MDTFLKLSSLQLDYPDRFQQFVLFQKNLNFKIDHFNNIGKFSGPFEFLNFIDPKIELYNNNVEMYSGDFLDPYNIYCQTKMFILNQSKNIELRNNEKLLPIARDKEFDGTTFLYLSNLQTGIFQIDIGWDFSPITEICPNIEMFFQKKNENDFKVVSNYLDNSKEILNYYKTFEKSKYGEIFVFDSEGFDELSSYRNFFIELFSKFKSKKLKLSFFETNEKLSSIKLGVNEFNFELIINQDRDWFDIGIVEGININLSKLLKTDKFIIIEDSKTVDQALKISLKRIE